LEDQTKIRVKKGCAVPGRKVASFKSLAGFDACGLENKSERTESGKSSLKKIQPDKTGKPEPVLIMIDGQQNTCQHKTAGYSKNEAINIHDILV